MKLALRDRIRFCDDIGDCVGIVTKTGKKCCTVTLVPMLGTPTETTDIELGDDFTAFQCLTEDDWNRLAVNFKPMALLQGLSDFVSWSLEIEALERSIDTGQDTEQGDARLDELTSYLVACNFYLHPDKGVVTMYD